MSNRSKYNNIVTFIFTYSFCVFFCCGSFLIIAYNIYDPLSKSSETCPSRYNAKINSIEVFYDNQFNVSMTLLDDNTVYLDSIFKIVDNTTVEDLNLYTVMENKTTIQIYETCTVFYGYIVYLKVDRNSPNEYSFYETKVQFIFVIVLFFSLVSITVYLVIVFIEQVFILGCILAVCFIICEKQNDYPTNQDNNTSDTSDTSSDEESNMTKFDTLKDYKYGSGDNSSNNIDSSSDVEVSYESESDPDEP